MVVEAPGTRGSTTEFRVDYRVCNNETDATPSAAYFTDSAHAARDTTDGLYTLIRFEH
jgi:hypothetical protein